MYNKDQIKEKIFSNQEWLERGIIAIFNKQTYSEQQSETTNEYNNVGFTHANAKRLSYYAKWINSGKHLTGIHVEIARKQMTKYCGQLAKIANKKI